MKIIKLCNFFDYMESFAYKQNITHVLYVTDFSSLFFFKPDLGFLRKHSLLTAPLCLHTIMYYQPMVKSI